MKVSNKVIVAFIVFVLLSAGLIYYGLSNSLVYFLTPTELSNLGEEAFRTPIRLKGTVVPGSVRFDLEANRLTFVLADENVSYPVAFNGLAPDTFREGLDAVVEGRLNREMVFEATDIFTKCASKYEPKA